MTRDVIVVIDGGWGLLMFFEPFSKSSGGLSCIFLITFHSITFISIDDPTLFQHWILLPYYKGLSESVKRTCNKTWGTSVLQRRCHHQKLPDGTQGPGSNAEKEWGHL